MFSTWDGLSLLPNPGREEVDQDDRRNDHIEQGRPGVERAKQNGIFLFLFVVPAALISSL
jgi:hypothetical protein